jgi:hypothetical protein
MINSAVHHIYTDGVDAALCFIAGAEMFLRDPHEDWLGYGESYELLYHVYNWHVLRGFMPKGTQELVDGLDDLKDAVASGDVPDDLLKRIGRLRDLLTGEGRSVSDIDAS